MSTPNAAPGFNNAEQSKPITGYRKLSEDEIAAMNRIKDAEAFVALLHSNIVATLPPRSEATRQAQIAKTEFEHAFMRLCRAVAQPVTPWEG